MNRVMYAIAQIATIRENVQQNLNKHLRFIQVAKEHRAQFVVFPELSLTGYEREKAKHQCFDINDARFDCLQDSSDAYDMILSVGVPLVIEKKLYISSVIFSPKQEKRIYIKKYLHEGEEEYFTTRTDYDPLIPIENETLCCAICYDIERDEHIHSAKKRNATMYSQAFFTRRMALSLVFRGCALLRKHIT